MFMHKGSDAYGNDAKRRSLRVDGVMLKVYCLTPMSTVLEKLIVIELVKKFTAFYGNRKFITVSTGARKSNILCNIS
jgi:hypothetical protein